MEKGKKPASAEAKVPMIIADAHVKFARDTVVPIVRSTALKRAIKSSNPAPSNFWNLIMATLYDSVINDWCILSGSDSKYQQKLHRKNMFDECKFRSDIDLALTAPWNKWIVCRNDLVKYRNENISHRDLNTVNESYPNLDIALEVSYVYFIYLKEPLKGISPNQTDLCLRKEYDKWHREFASFANAATLATAHL
jgi:hypothetical protein